MDKLDWGQISVAVGKVVGAAVTGAVAGYQSTGTWQGAAAGAIGAVILLFVPSPQSHQFIKKD